MVDTRAHLINVKEIDKSLATRIDELVNMVSKTMLIANVKELNTHISRFEYLSAALSPFGHTRFGSDTRDAEKVKESAVGMRQSARLQVTCRSAAIIQGNMRDKAKAVLDNAKALSVTMPPVMRTKLTVMKDAHEPAEAA